MSMHLGDAAGPPDMEVRGRTCRPGGSSQSPAPAVCVTGPLTLASFDFIFQLKDRRAEMFGQHMAQIR